jgi:hypothetical protein
MDRRKRAPISSDDWFRREDAVKLLELPHFAEVNHQVGQMP